MLRRWLLVLAALPALGRAETLTGVVVGVSDGDTVTVLARGNRSLKIRLNGIDAPESRQAFGQASKRWLSDQVYRKAVSIDVQDRDRYGRSVGVVRLGSRNVNVDSVRAGMAWWYRQYAPTDASLRTAEAEARRARRGLWSQPGAIPPWEFRRSSRTGETVRSVIGTTAVATVPAGTVYVTKAGKSYHRLGCRYVTSNSLPVSGNQVGSRKACKVCKP